MKRALSLAVVLGLMLALVACGGTSTAPSTSAPTTSGSTSTSTSAPAPAPSGKTQILTIGTADTGGTMYPVGASIAKVVNDNVANVKVNVETSAGSPENARNLQGGVIDLGMVSGDVAFDAFNGNGKFASDKTPDLCIISGMYPSLSNWMVLDSAKVEFVSDLNGKKCAVGPTASTTEISARIALEAAGITYPTGVEAQFVGLGEGADGVRDGVYVATHAFAGVPVGGQLDLSNTKPSHLLKYTPEHLDKIIAANGSYYKAIIPANTYANQKEDIPTFGVKCTVAASTKMDEQLAYDMAKALHEHVEDLVAGHASMASMRDASFMCTDLPIPLHPGAERYYKEVGLLK